jgi:hypothetical protein
VVIVLSLSVKETPVAEKLNHLADERPKVSRNHAYSDRRGLRSKAASRLFCWRTHALCRLERVPYFGFQ